MDDINHGKRVNLELRLELVGLLKGLEDLEGSVEFMSFEARQVLEEAGRRISIRYIV